MLSSVVVLILSVFFFIPESFAAPGQQIGAQTALQLTQQAEQIVGAGNGLQVGIAYLDPRDGQRLLDQGSLEAERIKVFRDLESGNSNCHTSSGTQADTANTDDTASEGQEKRWKFDIELQAMAINGFNPFGSSNRVPYEEARFNGSVSDYFDNNPNLDLSNMSVFQAQQLIMEGGAFEQNMSQEVYDSVLGRMLAGSSPSRRRQLLQEAGQNMSFDRQMQFIAKMGRAMLNNYDSSREDQAISASGTSVSCDQILNNLYTDNDTGVCRDIVMCQAQLLEQMGNKGNVYGISYAVVGNYHVSLVAQDPNDKTKVHKINYDNHTVQGNSQGVAAISPSDAADVGIGYRIWKPDGKMAGTIPSQVGLILNEMTGGNNQQDYDPFVQNNYNVAQIGAGYDGFYGRVFASRLENGDTVYGVAAQYSWGDEPPAGQNGVTQAGHIGLAYAHRDSLRITGSDGTTIEYDINQAYLNFQQRVGYKFNPTENLTVTPYVDFRLQATAIHGESTGTSGWTGDGDLTADTGVEASWISPDGDTQVDASVYTQTTLGLNNLSGLNQVTPVTNHTVVSLAAKHHVSPEVALNAYFLASFREYGNSGSVGVGVTHYGDSATTSVNVGLTAPLGAQSQAWMPGGNIPTLSTTVSQQIYANPNFQIDWNVNYSQQLGGENNYNVTTGVGFHF